MGSNRSGWNTAQQGASRCSSPTPFAAFASLLLPFPPFMSSFCVVFVTFSVNKPTTTCPPSHTPNRAFRPPLSFSPPSSDRSASPSLKGQPSVSSVITTIHICRGSFFFPSRRRGKLARMHVAAKRAAALAEEGNEGGGGSPMPVAEWLPSYGTDPYYPSRRIRRITERVYFKVMQA